jgi:hypothetical protein
LGEFSPFGRWFPWAKLKTFYNKPKIELSFSQKFFVVVLVELHFGLFLQSRLVTLAKTVFLVLLNPEIIVFGMTIAI